MISAKNRQVMTALIEHSYDSKLTEIIDWFFGKYKKGVVTEGYRDSTHSGDLHGLTPVRAIDLRSWCYDSPEKMACTINNYWEYDPERPHMKVCVYHKTARNAMHFHIQVHPNTKRRKKRK